MDLGAEINLELFILIRESRKGTSIENIINYPVTSMTLFFLLLWTISMNSYIFDYI